MAQITTGIRAILSSPSVYNFMQTVFGAKQSRIRFVDQFLRPYDGMRILDVGCGPAEILGFLPKSVRYVGYDISPSYIDQARQRYGDRGEFHCRLMTADEAKHLGQFDLVLALGLLHHLDDPEARDLFAVCKPLVAPGGRMLTLDGAYIDRQNPLARFVLSQDRGQNVRSPEGYKALAESAFEYVDGTIVHSAWIPYTRWIMEARTTPAQEVAGGSGHSVWRPTKSPAATAHPKEE